MRKIVRIVIRVVSWILLYLVGILIGLLFNLLKWFGKIEVKNPGRFPRWQGKMIIAANHPSLLDPFLLPALLFPQYLLRPFKYAPWSTPDWKNFYKAWYWFWLRPRAIPIVREKRKTRREEKEEKMKPLFLLRMKTTLESGGIIILFPEAGRTHKGTKFHYSKSKRKRVREMRPGIGWLAVNVKPVIVPIWLEGTEEVWLKNKRFPSLKFWNWNILIKIGEPIKFHLTDKPTTSEKATKKIGQRLLKTADEE